MIPTALTPVVILVLKLNPADIIDFFIDKLLVASASKLWTFEHPSAETCHVIFGIGTN